mgnify:CR=1 FL=1
MVFKQTRGYPLKGLEYIVYLLSWYLSHACIIFIRWCLNGLIRSVIWGESITCLVVLPSISVSFGFNYKMKKMTTVASLSSRRSPDFSAPARINSTQARFQGASYSLFQGIVSVLCLIWGIFLLCFPYVFYVWWNNWWIIQHLIWKCW